MKTKLPLAPRPIYAVWELTLRCDLACKHCGSRAGRAREGELSTSDALDLVGELADLGVHEVTLIGGEAYLRDDWLAIVRRIRERGMSCSMTTGGRAIDGERARAAADAGLRSVSISLDGLAATHDRLRGLIGSFTAARASAAELRKVGITITCNTQINRRNANELPALLDVIIAERMVAWQIALTVPMGRAADRPEILLQPYELGTLFPVLGELATRARENGVHLMAGNNIGYFGPYESILRVAPTAGCGAACATIGIEADGTIKGCPSLPTASWGASRTASLEHDWSAAEPLTRLRKPRKLWGYCAECYYASVCGGGCTWTADALFGKPGNNPYCHHRVLELAKRGIRERVERIAEAPGVPFDVGRFELVTEPTPTGPI